MTDLERENEQLRQLIRDMLPCYRWSDCFGGCANEGERFAACPTEIEQRMRALGIEVDR